jgi:CPA1 family monovalent cation:H+ antiporter
MIPAMPLPVAFALAAVISPTDAVAVSGITSRIAVPRRLMHILEGESLLNDASGLVCLRFAIAAALTGVFSIHQALGAFVWLAAGGVATGVVVTLAATKAKTFIADRFGEDAGSQILISLLIPFGASMAAERLHCSGILAAVAAGISMSYAELSGRAMATTRLQRVAVWNTVQFAVNGIIFVLLGEQLPAIFSQAVDTVQLAEHENPWWLAVYVIVINIGLGVSRFLWVWGSLKLTILRNRGQGEHMKEPGWRVILATSLAGVRGAITLAGVLTLPLLAADGKPFPARELAIFLAAGVIIISLLGATVGLPPLLRNLQVPPDDARRAAEDIARAKAAEAGIRAVQEAAHRMAGDRPDADVYAGAATRVMDLYRRRIDGYSATGEEQRNLKKAQRIERELRLAGLEAERGELFRLARAGEIGDDLMRRLVSELDLRDAEQAIWSSSRHPPGPDPDSAH